MDGLIKHSATINKLLARYGVKFGIYKNGEFKEQLFPFDPIPRVIAHGEFVYLEKGLKQRVDTLNCFLRDIYGKKQILKDGIIPEAFVFSARGYLSPCDGVVPPKGIYSHISGIDLIDDEQTRNIIKLGKGIERLDLYLSLDRPAADIRREYGRMQQFLRKSHMHHDESILYTIDNMLFEDGFSYGNVRSLLRNLITA